MNKKLLMILLALSLSAAFFVVGCSSDDDEPTVTAPNAPTGVTATIVSPTVVRIDWTASALDEAPNGYAIERRTAEGDWSEIGSVGVSVTTYNDNTIAMGSGTTYLYHVGAYNDGGSTFSSSATVTVDTFTELLLGTWDAPDPSQGGIGVDSMSIIFEYNATLQEYRYTRTDHYASFDDEDVEEGVYSATATGITWTMDTVNGNPVTPATYTWNYSIETSGEAMTVEYIGTTPYDVDLVKV